MNNSQFKIEAIARQLDRVLPPGDQRINPDMGDPLIRAAVDFAQSLFPEITPTALEKIEGHMLKAYTPPRSIIRFPITRRAAAVASFAAVMMVGSLVPVAAASLPGEPLYPLKQGYEQIELFIASNMQAEANVYLNQAQRRLDEGNILLQRGIYNADVFSESLSNARTALSLDETDDVTERIETLTMRVEASLLLAQQENLVTAASLEPLEDSIQILRANFEPLDVLPATETPMPTATVTQTFTPTPTATATQTFTPTMTPTATVTATKPPTRVNPTARPTKPPNATGNTGQGSQGTPNLGEASPVDPNPPADPGQGNQGTPNLGEASPVDPNPPADPGQGNQDKPANQGSGNSSKGGKP